MIEWARDYFGLARRAALELRALDLKHESLRSACRLGAVKLSERRTGDFDPQAAIDELVDFEKALDGLRAPHAAILDDAINLLYGPRGRLGVAKLLGTRNADVLCWRWLQLRRWREIARDLGCSVRWAQEIETKTFNWLDEFGEMHLREQNAVELDYYESMRGDE